MPFPRKRFAQHWLTDAGVHAAIVAAADLRPGSDLVLEIGPGTGQLSRRLLAAGARVVAVEIDRDLCRLLRRQFADQPDFMLIEGDFLAMDLPAEPSLLVANIPYNITSPILEKVLGSPQHPVRQFRRIVLLVQKELAVRISAAPNHKVFGAMSVRVQYLAEPELVRSVPPQAFKPAPKVESAVIVLTPRPFPVVAADPRWFSLLVQQGFATRRKMLVNALHSLIDKGRVGEALAQLGVDPMVRAEALDVATWVQLSNVLSPNRAAQTPPTPAESTDRAILGSTAPPPPDPLRPLGSARIGG